MSEEYYEQLYEKDIDWTEILKEIDDKNHPCLKVTQRLSRENNHGAQNNLGFLYFKGIGVEQDYRKSFNWYLKSANQNNNDAQHNLGFLYRRGIGVEQDYQKSFNWYLKSANQNNLNSQNSVGYMYSNGLGVEQDNKKAIEWYGKASLNGFDYFEHIKLSEETTYKSKKEI